MGSVYSRGILPDKIQAIFPVSVAALQAKYNEFLLHVEQDSQTQSSKYFITRVSFQKVFKISSSEIHMLWDCLTKQDGKKRCNVMEIFGAMALLCANDNVTVKYEFILSLIASKETSLINHCEMMMLLLNTSKGLSTMKGAPTPSEKLLNKIAERAFQVYQSKHEDVKGLDIETFDISFNDFIEYAYNEPLIIYYMYDLSPSSKTNVNEIITQQQRMFAHLAEIDFKISIMEHDLNIPSKSASVKSLENFAEQQKMLRDQKRKRKQMKVLQSSRGGFNPFGGERKENGESFCPQMNDQKIPKYLRNLKETYYRLEMEENTKVPNLQYNKVLGIGLNFQSIEKFQNMIEEVTDYTICIMEDEASQIVEKFPRDQLNRVKVQPVLKWFQSYLSNLKNASSPPENPAQWKIILRSFYDACYGRYEQTLRQWEEFKYKMKRFNPKLSSDLVLNISSLSLAQLECEGQMEWAFCEPPPNMRGTSIRFEIVHGSTRKSSLEWAGIMENEEAEAEARKKHENDYLEDTASMGLILRLLLHKQTEQSDVEELVDALNYCLNSPIVQGYMFHVFHKALVEVVHCDQTIPGVLDEEVHPTMYLKVSILSQKDFFQLFKGATSVDLENLFVKLDVHVQLSKTLKEIYNTCKLFYEYETKLYDSPDSTPSDKSAVEEFPQDRAPFEKKSLSTFAVKIVHQIFKRFDLDKDGALNLHELNEMQKAMNQPLILSEDQYRELTAEFSCNEKGDLTRAGLLESYAQYGGLEEDIRALGYGSLNECIQGNMHLNYTSNTTQHYNMQHLFLNGACDNLFEKGFCFLMMYGHRVKGKYEVRSFREVLETLRGGFVSASSSSSSASSTASSSSSSFWTALLEEPAGLCHGVQRVVAWLTALRASLQTAKLRTGRQLELENQAQGQPAGTAEATHALLVHLDQLVSAFLPEDEENDDEDGSARRGRRRRRSVVGVYRVNLLSPYQNIRGTFQGVAWAWPVTAAAAASSPPPPSTTQKVKESKK